MNSKQDANGVRSARDLERKYDFASLLGLKKNIQITKDALIKVNNELNNILNSVLINLADVIDSQSEVSLWFFDGLPTLNNKPYTDWITPSEHYGDIYYDRQTGYVYQYNSNGWIRKNDTKLIEAMSLTNVELDITVDHERKVYFSQPTPPYSSGDWWILEDGTLKICQLGKTSGIYETEDFVVSSKYTSTLATKTGNTITVLKGNIVSITESMVTVEDLATGGRTAINGANITTGHINTDNISIGNENVQIDEDGIKLNNGAKLVGEYGLYTNLQFKAFGVSESLGDEKSAGEYKLLGFSHDNIIGNDKYNIFIDYYIPSNFRVVSAYITLRHIPYKITMNDNSIIMGYARNIKCFNGSANGSICIPGYESSEYNPGVMEGLTYSEINNCFNNNDNKFTPEEPNLANYGIEQIITNDIGNQLSTSGRIKIATQNSIPSTVRECYEETGFIYAQLNVYGYIAY